MFKLLLNAGAVRGGEEFGLERERERRAASGDRERVSDGERARGNEGLGRGSFWATGLIHDSTNVNISNFSRSLLLNRLWSLVLNG